MEGWLFDVYPDRARNRMVLWLLEGGEGGNRSGTRPGVRGFRHVFRPSMYVSGPRADLLRLKDMYSGLSSVRGIGLQERMVDIADDAPREVLEIEIGRYSELHRMARSIDRMGGFHHLALYNVDLRLPSRFMVEAGVFPLARMRIEPSRGRLVALDDQFDMDYPLPPLRTVHMEVSVDPGRGIPTLDDEIDAIVLTSGPGPDTSGRPLSGHRGHDDDAVSLPERSWTLDGGKGGEETILRELLSAIGSLDPDVIFTTRGDSFDLPLLYHRSSLAGMGETFTLGREGPEPGEVPAGPAPAPGEDRDATEPARTPPRGRGHRRGRSRSYFSYGRIVHKPAAHLLRGRWHIDMSSFHMRESGLCGLMDLSRISCIPVQEMSRLSPGTAISTMQLLEALRSGHLVAWKKNIPERFKSARNLLASDRGGLILEPRVGLHDHVAEIDFASLYPNIMVKHNISPETIFCDCCEAGPRDLVPEAGYHFCRRREGLVPRVLRPVIDRRFEFKRRSRDRSRPEGLRAAWREMDSILKWLLVVCFGYTGYKNARFGRIECHEAITSYAREILVHAMNMAEANGFEVLHGIVDSLWVRGRGDVTALCDAIGRSVDIPIELEGHYRWIVFVPNRTNRAGALNRYYGAFEDGEVKARGIELRRNDTPAYFRRVQDEMLSILARARNAGEFMDLLPSTLEVLSDHGSRLADGGVDPRQLVFLHRISRPLPDYRVFGNQVAALRHLEARGFSLEPGQEVGFVITDSDSRDWRRRVQVAEFVDPDTDYDRDKYIEYLCRCGESILLPFGYDLERLLSLVKG